MIEPTMDRLLKLQVAIKEQAETLPEYSVFGTKNDLANERQKVELIAWCIENFDNKDILNAKAEELERKMDKSIDDDLLYDRFCDQLTLIDFVVGNSNEYYLTYFDEDDEVLE